MREWATTGLVISMYDPVFRTTADEFTVQRAKENALKSLEIVRLNLWWLADKAGKDELKPQIEESYLKINGYK